METERISYHRLDQKNLRAADYTELRDFWGNTGGIGDESECIIAGRLFVLLKTYFRGDRYMRQKINDIIDV